MTKKLGDLEHPNTRLPNPSYNQPPKTGQSYKRAPHQKHSKTADATECAQV